MAFSPCPKCQNGKEFRELFDKHTILRAMELAGYLYQPSRDGEIICTKDETHVYTNENDVRRDLKQAGYLNAT